MVLYCLLLMSKKWNVKKIDVCYPSDNITDKIFSIEKISLKYNEYNLQLNFTDDIGFVLYVDNNPLQLLEEIYGFDRIHETIKKYKLPKINNKIIFNNITKYFICGNDDDGNNDGEINGKLIKASNYGVPIMYNSVYYIKDYDYSTNEDEKNNLENIIKNGVFYCFDKFSMIKQKITK